MKKDQKESIDLRWCIQWLGFNKENHRNTWQLNCVFRKRCKFTKLLPIFGMVQDIECKSISTLPDIRFPGCDIWPEINIRKRKNWRSIWSADEESFDQFKKSIDIFVFWRTWKFFNSNTSISSCTPAFADQGQGCTCNNRFQYEMEKELGNLVCPENIQPDMELLNKAIGQGKNSAMKNEKGYGIVAK